MCGILGTVSHEGVDRVAFETRLKMLNHRGPDDYGVFIDEHIALGHTRLSILDLSPLGHQPMLSDDGSYIIIYNGEVYNFEEIKKELEAKGHHFNSHSDTEVILKGFMEYGEGVVNRLNGMFAFAILNRTTKELFLARDRSGMKPLYYVKNEREFAFASEIRPLKSYAKGLNIEAKMLFLLLGSVPEPLSIYEGIETFPAGAYGYYHPQRGLRTQIYNDFIYQPKIDKPYEEMVDDVGELLHQSVKRHLISDAPIGTFLSGGLDSSAITAIAAEYKDELQTLSLVFNEKEFSEEYYQDLVAKHYGTKHTKYLIDEALFLSSIDDFMASIDQPTIDGINTFFVSKAAREIGLKTVLSGVGGDEIFYGYASFGNASKLKTLKSLPSFIVSMLKFSHKYKKLELLAMESELALYLPTRAVFAPSEVASILKVDVALVYQAIAKIWEYYNSEKIEALEDKISFFELRLYMKNQLLRDTDVFGMANSLEIRVPFMDQALVDYVLRIPPKDKFDKRINKIILADAVKSLLPNEVIDRPKMGFTLPFEGWFRKNIDRFELDPLVKEQFVNHKLHWSRVWTDIVLKRFEQDYQAEVN